MSDAQILVEDISVFFPLYHASARSLKKTVMAAASGRLGKDKQRRVVERLRRTDGTGIVYAATVRQVETLTDLLEREGLRVARYHGRFAAGRRREHQERFMAGELDALVATNASARLAGTAGQTLPPAP